MKFPVQKLKELKALKMYGVLQFCFVTCSKKALAVKIKNLILKY